MARAERLRSLFGIDLPIVLAPLAGGPSTPELTAAVSNAGGLGSLGVAYLVPSAIHEAVASVRKLTGKPFAVNLFTPELVETDLARAAEVQSVLGRYRRELGIGEPTLPSVLSLPFDEQLDVLLAEKVPIVSFTFGPPTAATVERLHGAGSLVVGTATTVAEARALEEAGCDAISAQGAEAGGHRGTFPGTRGEDVLVGTMALVPQIVDAVKLPVMAAGGIMDGRGVVAALALGAVAAQLGSAFLLADEAGTDAAARAKLAVADETSTTVTRAFTGKAARGLRNRFVEEWGTREPAPFPVQHVLTSDIRAAARKAGNADLVNLWAGQGIAMARRLPAADIVARIVEEMAVARAEI